MRDGAAKSGFVAERDIEDAIGSGEIFFQQHRRQRKNVADVVETVAGVVRRKINRGIEADGGEIADAVAVFSWLRRRMTTWPGSGCAGSM